MRVFVDNMEYERAWNDMKRRQACWDPSQRVNMFMVVVKHPDEEHVYQKVCRCHSAHLGYLLGMGLKFESKGNTVELDSVTIHFVTQAQFPMAIKGRYNVMAYETLGGVPKKLKEDLVRGLKTGKWLKEETCQK